jgi:2-oxoglutarate dehydrogenase E2 component (dihydrolipoamide succinyltransferase)
MGCTSARCQWWYTLRLMMHVAANSEISYDHRIVDGAEAVGFLVHIKNAIENPERMLLGL